MSDRLTPDIEWRLGHVEEELADLKAGAVDREWLDERIGRTEDKIEAAWREAAADRNAIRADLDETKGRVAEKNRTEAHRRNATYVAVLGAGLSLIIVILQSVPM